jgi:hypothetical protein
LKPKDSFKECDICPEMVVVPKGSFMMGTPADEPYRLKGEDPVHKVTIAHPFAVGRFTISFDEWDACLADGGCNGYKGSGGYGRGRMPADGSISSRRNPIWHGCRARSAAPTGCRANPNANISPAPAPPRHSGSARPSPPRTPITTPRTIIPAGRMAQPPRARSRSTPICRTSSGFIRSMAMPRNGPRTVTTSAIPRTRRPTARRGSKATAPSACCAAAAGMAWR